MGIYTQIEIAAPPEVVRETLLDFSNISQWHSGFVKKITPLSEDGDPKADGKKLHCEMEGFTFDSTITTNTPRKFAWQGPPVFELVAGLHTFELTSSSTTSGGTTFVQKDDYKGIGTPLMNQALLGGKIKRQFEGFNQDLKKKCEAKA